MFRGRPDGLSQGGDEPERRGACDGVAQVPLEPGRADRVRCHLSPPVTSDAPDACAATAGAPGVKMKPKSDCEPFDLVVHLSCAYPGSR